MSNIILDQTPPPALKTDKNGVPPGQDPNKYGSASDLNYYRQLTLDTQAAFNSGRFLQLANDTSPTVSVPGAVKLVATGGKAKISVDGGIFQSVFNTRLRVADYGTWDPTGVLDGTAALNACIQAARALMTGLNYGAIIELGRGTFKLTGTALVNEALGIFLVGDGVGATTLKASGMSGLPMIQLRNASFCGVVGMVILGQAGSAPMAGIEIRRETGHTGGFVSTKNVIADVQLGNGTAYAMGKGISISGDLDANNDFHTFSRVVSGSATYADVCIDNSQSVGQQFRGCNLNGITSGTTYGIIVGGTRDRSGDNTQARGGKFTWRGGSCGGHVGADFYVAAEGPGVNTIDDCGSEGSNMFLGSASLPGVASSINLNNIRFGTGANQLQAYAINWGFGGHLELTNSRFDLDTSSFFAKIRLQAISAFTYVITGNQWNQTGTDVVSMIEKNIIAAGGGYPGGSYYGIESNLYASASGYFTWKGTGTLTDYDQTILGNKTINGYVVAGSGLYSDTINAKTANTPISIQGQTNDAAASVDVRIGSGLVYANVNAKLVGFYNAAAMKAAVSSQGDFINRLDVRFFGVRGDDATDNTTTLQTAIAAALASGATLYFPEGIYRTTGISIDAVGAPLSVRGEGGRLSAASGSVIKYIGASGGTLLHGSGIASSRFQGISFDGNSLASKVVHIDSIKADGTTFSASFDVTFERCGFFKFKTADTNAVLLALGSTGAGASAQVSEVRVKNCLFRGNEYTTNDHYGTAIKNLTSGNCKNFWVNDSNFVNLDVGTSLSDSIGTVERCYFGEVRTAIGGGAPQAHVVACGMESTNVTGGSRFISTTTSNAPGSMSVKNCYVALVAPSDDLGVIANGGHLNLEGNFFWNRRTSDYAHEFKVQAWAYKTTVADGGGQQPGSVISHGNHYYGVTIPATGYQAYAPIYDPGGSNMFKDSNGMRTTGTRAESVGDYSKNASGVTFSLQDCVPFAETRAAALVWASPAVQIDGGTVTRARSRASLKAAGIVSVLGAGTTASFQVGTIPAGWRVVGVRVEADPFTASGMASMTFKLGTVAVDNALILSSSVFGISANTQFGLVDSDLGAGMARATAVQGGFLPSMTVATNINITLTSNVNLNTLTAGELRFVLITEQA
jgi:hypothetical protein